MGYHTMTMHRFTALIALVLLNAAIEAAGSEGVTGGKTSSADRAMTTGAPGRLFEPARLQRGNPTLRIDRGALEQARTHADRFVVPAFPLSRGETVDLELQTFRVAGKQTRFVLGRTDGSDEPLAFDVDAIMFLRGTVVGHPGSHVFMALSETLSTGKIELGRGRSTHYLSSSPGGGRPGVTGEVVVFPATAQHGGMDVPLCGLDSPRMETMERNLERAVEDTTSTASPAMPVKGVRTIELAIETDHEFYQVFGDSVAASTYVTMLMGAVSDIFIREAAHRFELTYVRIWDTPTDPYDQPDGFDAFSAFVGNWQTNMGGVQRDAAQFLSGRRDLPFGGVAYLGVVCTDWAYSMSGYLIGFFPDPDTINGYHYDIEVAAHELGHNADSPHTDAYSPPIDQCYPPPTVPQRGTIMSYCSQAVSGGNAVHELRFHSRVQTQMRNFLSALPCVIDDCNMNNVPDATDIAGSTSVDTDGNGVPDECDDCDGDGTLDFAAIAGGAPDLNGNGIPDNCEADCNGNGIPDDRDILLGTSTDAYGDNVPDSCETDCDGNGVSDFTQIQLLLSLDINRNARLDSCEDCDGDGTLDAEERDGAHNMWVASDLADNIGEYHGDSGVLVKNAVSGGLADPQDIAISATGRIFVSSALDDRIVEFDRSGLYQGDFVPAGVGGLDYPTGLLIRPNGNLLVASRNTSSVLEYDGDTGAPLGAFVGVGSGGLLGPFGLVMGPNGNLFVNGVDSQVREYDGSDGTFIRIFVTMANNGGLLDPRGMAFKPDGNLLVAGFTSDTVHEYDGIAGTYVGVFPNGGTIYGPWGVRVGPNGNVYITRDFEGLAGAQQADGSDLEPLHATTTRIYEYDPWTGMHLRSYLLGDDTGLYSPTGIAFMPGAEVDCDVNFLPDSCDEAPSEATGDKTEAAVCTASSTPQAEMLATPGAPENVKNRFVSIHAGDAGQSQSIRISYASQPAPFDAWSGEQFYVGQPFQVCENSGQGLTVSPPNCGPAPGVAQRWFWAAPVDCFSLEPYAMDWTTLTDFCAETGEPCTADCHCSQGTCGVDGTVHLFGPGIVPSRLQTGGGGISMPSVYEIDVIDENCPLDSADSYSAPLVVTQAAWGDIVASVTECPNRPSNLTVDVIGDVVAIATKFSNLPCAPTKARVDLEPCAVDFMINITDAVQALDAFTGEHFPYSADSPSPCDSAQCGY